MSRLLAVGCVLAVVLLTAMSATAQASAGPLLTDGAVVSIATSPSTVYLGGTFSRVSASPVGEAATIDTTSGSGRSAVTQVTGGVVTAAVSDGSGGWFLAGTFTAVGGRPRTGLAHLLPTGSIDPHFDPTVVGTISALALAGTTLYAGGSFTIGNQSDLAALSTSDGSVAAGVTVSAKGPVDALLLSGSTLYLGGSFTSVDSVTHDGLAAINAADGTLVAPAFTPDVDVAARAGNEVDALTLSGATLYLGGRFRQVDARPRVGLAAVSATSGNLVSAFSPDMTSAHIAALAISGGSLYVAGQWSSPSTHVIGAFSSSTGAVLSTFNVPLGGHDPLTPASVSALLVSGNTLYIGGYFSSVDSTARYNLAAVSTTTGALTASWHPDPGGLVDTLALAGGSLEAGGDVRFLGGTPRRNLAAISTSTGTLDTRFTPNLSGEAVTSLLLSGSTLYIGGELSAPASRFNLVALNATTGGLITGFDPAVNGYINAMVLSGTTLYIAGGINLVDGTARTNLAAVSTVDGSLIAGFDPTVGNIASFVRALLLRNGILYVGGQFNGIDGDSTRSDLAALNAGDGSLLTTFNPRANGTVQALAGAGSTLYAGGAFTSLGTAPAPGLAELNLASGAPIGSFHARLDGGTLSLLLSGTTLYVGGLFAHVDGAARSDVAALNAASGTLATQSTPGAVGVFVSSILSRTGVYALGQSGATLYLGGPLLQIGSAPAGGFGSFAVPPVPQPPVSTARPTVSGRVLPGHTASCSTGRWTNHPTHFVYQWSRQGRAVPGADTAFYRIRIADEAQSLACTVTASNLAGSGRPTTSATTVVALKGTLGCPRPSGELTARQLGPISLGLKRNQVHRRLHRFTALGRNVEDLCLYAGWGIYTAYANNRVVLVLTANPFYKLHGIAPGLSRAQTEAALKLVRPIHTRAGDLYLTRGRVLKLRSGIVQQVGIAARQLTRNQLRAFRSA